MLLNEIKSPEFDDWQRQKPVMSKPVDRVKWNGNTMSYDVYDYENSVFDSFKAKSEFDRSEAFEAAKEAVRQLNQRLLQHHEDNRPLSQYDKEYLELHTEMDQLMSSVILPFYQKHGKTADIKTAGSDEERKAMERHEVINKRIGTLMQFSMVSKKAKDLLYQKHLASRK
jgi:hypothetical protein